jgi:protein gp37
MADGTKIEWADATLNPLRARNLQTGKLGFHCVHKSEGCRNCYAEGINLRLGTGLPYKPGHEKDIEIFVDLEMLAKLFRWRKPRRVFLNSMSDTAGEFVSDEDIAQQVAYAASAWWHQVLILTKRPDRLRRLFTDPGFWEIVDDFAGECDEVANALGLFDPLARRKDDYRAMAPCLDEGHKEPPANIWLGTSVEDQATAEARIPDLLGTPAALRWISAEPLLGPVDAERWTLIRWQCSRCRAFFTGQHKPSCPECGCLGGWTGSHPFNGRQNRRTDVGSGIDWIVAGGESGPAARPCHPDWIRSLRDQCGAAGVPFFLKQWGEWHPGTWKDDGDAAVFTPLDPVVKVTGLGDHRRAQHRVHWFTDQEPDGPGAVRVGKKAAGAVLDGRQHREYPR